MSDGLLALDLGEKAGWALYPPGGLPGGRFRFGVWSLAPGIDDAPAKWAALLDVLDDLHGVHGFGRLSVEAPLPVISQTRQDFAVMAMGLAAAARLFAWRRALSHTERNAATVRRAMLGIGHGHAKKPEIVAWCRARGYDVWNDNAADALLLGHYEIAPVGSAWPPTPANAVRA